MGSNRSGRRRTQRMKRHRKEVDRLVKKALAAEGQSGQGAKPAEAAKG